MKGLQRFISGILAVCLLVSMLPVSAWATETEPAVETVPETTVVETQETIVDETTEETTESSPETTAATEAAVTETSATEPGETTAPATEESAEATEETAESLFPDLTEIDDNAALDASQIAVYVASGICGENLTWTLDDAGVLTISGSGAMYDYYPGDDEHWLSDHVSPELVTSVVFDGNITHLGAYAFSGTSIVDLTIPASITSMDVTALYGIDTLSGIWIESGNPNFTNDAYSVLYDINKTALIKMPNCFDGEYTIPSGVTFIYGESFCSCPNLTKVTIPDGVETIENSTFSGCSGLREIIIPASVTSIGFAAFNDCASLETVYYTGTEEEWAAIDIYDAENDALYDAKIYCNYSPVKLTGWQTAYANYISEFRTAHESWGNWDTAVSYEPIYIDNDDIPELFIVFENYSGFSYGHALLRYTNEGVVGTDSFGYGSLEYIERGGLYRLSWNVNGYQHEAVCSLDSGKVTNLGGSADIGYDNTSIIEYTWGDATVSQAEYQEKVNALLPQDQVKHTGSDNSKIFDYDGILEWLLEVDTEEQDKENGLVVFSDYSNMSIHTGSIITLSAGILVDGIRLEDVSGITFRIDDTSILSVVGTGEENNSRYVKLKGIKEGETSIAFTDSATGYTARVSVSVYDRYHQSYALSDVPEVYIEKFPTNFYNINGLYIDQYKYSIDDQKNAIVTFDVYNTNYTYGTVEACDEYGYVQEVVLIEKMSSPNSSLKRAIWDNIGFIIRDIRDKDFLTYRQETGFSKKTPVSIKVPANGYLKICTSSSDSAIVAIVNGADFLMSMTELGGDLKDFTKHGVDFARKLAEELVTARGYAKIIKDGSDIPKELAKNLTNEVLISFEFMDKLSKTMAQFLDKKDISTAITKTTGEFGWNIGESIATYCTGPAGLALEAIFLVGKVENVIYQAKDFVQAIDASSIDIFNQGGGLRASQQIKVEGEKDFSDETVLNVYTVEIDPTTLDFIQLMDPELHTEITEGITYTYNISLLENGEEIQPDSTVTVYIPIPEDLKVLAYIGKVNIYRTEEDGSMTKMDIKIEDGCFVFTTDHFSLYTLVGYSPDTTDHKHIYTDNICEICGITGGICGETLSWALYEEGILSITGSGEMYDFEFEESPWFDYRDQITEILLPDGLTRIGENAFRGLYKVQSVTIPESVTEIGSCAFIMTGLTSVSLPEGLLTIDSSAFSHAPLKTVDIPDSVTHIDSRAFSSCNLENVHIPASVATIGGGAFSDCRHLKSISVDPDNANFTTDESGVLYSSDMTTLYQCPGGFVGEYVIPDGVTTLECSSFYGCNGLTKVTIPNSVVNMYGQSTFEHCTELTELILPDGITVSPVGFAFCCESLKTVKLPNQLKALRSLSFYGCTSLTRITIPASVATIADGCFQDSSLRSVIFRGSAPSINETAFTGVTATAYYPGNDPSWTADTMLNYGGSLTWVPVYENETVTHIDAKKTILNAGETLDLTAVLDPGVLVDEEIIWTLYDNGDGGGTELITENGTTAKLYAGFYLYDNVITVTAQAANDSAEPAVLEITIRQREADYTLFAGKSVTLKETDPATGKPYASKRLQWYMSSENEPYATLTSAGKLTAKKVVSKNRIIVYADIDGKPGFMRVVDIYPAVTQVDVMWEDNNPINGKTIPVDFTTQNLLFTVTAHPLDTMQNVTWSISDSEKQTYAEYETNGRVLRVFNLKRTKAGTVTVKATVDAGQKKSTTFKLQFGSFAKEVKITAASNSLQSGNSLQLSAVTVPAKPTKSGITWSLSQEDKAYASISSSGLLKAKTVYGRTEITVIATSKDGQAQAEFPVTILPANSAVLLLKCGGKNVTKDTVYVDLNGDPTITLTAERFDRLAQPSVTWSVPKSAEVLEKTDTTLTLRFLKAGTATITATGADKQKATVKVVAAQMAQSVEISQKKTNLTEGFEVASGKTLELKATVENAKNKKVTWSLAPGDEAYAKISSSGKLTAAKNLTTMRQVTVTATAADGSGIYDEAVVSIRPIAQGVQIYSVVDGVRTFSVRSDPSRWVRSNTVYEWDMVANTRLTLSSHVYPYYAENHPRNAMQGVTWKSSSPKVASVDANGNVICHKPGSTTITATAKDGSSKKVTFKLTVVKKTTGLQLPDQQVIGGKTLALNKLVQYSPTDVTNKTLKWEIIGGTGTDYATLSSKGSLKTKKVTKPVTVTVRITATDGTHCTDTCTVTILPKS